MGGMVRLLATIGAKGASKFLKRRKKLGGDKAAKSASAFVKRRQQMSRAKPIKKAMGGEAAESVGRATVVKSQRDARRKEVDEMLDRVYSKVSEAKGIGKIVPKKKPKNPNIIKPKPKKKSFVIYNSKTKKFRTGSNPGNNEKIVKID